MPNHRSIENVHRQAIACIERGDWQCAHEYVEDEGDTLSCLIHAYLHREEGDMSNARYWYGRAGEHMPANTLAQELTRLRERVTGTG